MDDDRLIALAEQVRAGAHIDWQAQAESSGDEKERQIIRNMALLAQIADLHADLQSPASMDRPRAEEAPSAGDQPTVESVLEGIGQPEMPPTGRWGHLEQLEFIGRGSFGVVCKAWDPKLEVHVALKLARPGLDADSREEEMLEEARLMARVRHENVVRIYGAAKHDDRPGIWMEFIEGQTLASIVKFEGRMDEDRVRKVGRTLALALAAVHNENVVHKDVKAQNVMVESGGRLVLMDFGASARGEDITDVVTEDAPRGTPYYLAPEIFASYSPSNQSDIYSLGVLLFHLLTGRFPVEAEDARELVQAHQAGRRQALIDVRPGMSPDLRRAIDRALDPVPAQRFESAGRMAEALRERRRDWVPWIIALVLALAGSYGGWVVHEQRASFEVGASLYRDGRVRQELHSGSRVEVGDKLFLELETSKPLYVYVFNQDAKGAAALLFPIPGLTPQNPIAPNQTHRLPGISDTGPVNWLVTSAGDRERFWIFGSRERVDELEELLEQLPKAEFGRYPAVDPETFRALRGITGLVPKEEPMARAESTAATEFFNRIDELTRDKERHRGVWVRRVELENP